MNFIVMAPYLLLGWAEFSEQLRLLDLSLHLHIERDQDKSTRITIIFLDHTMRAVPHDIVRRDCQDRTDEQLSGPSAATTL
jgi:hypothetical protein